MPSKKNFLDDAVHLNEDAMIKYAVQVRMAGKCDDFRVINPLKLLTHTATTVKNVLNIFYLSISRKDNGCSFTQIFTF